MNKKLALVATTLVLTASLLVSFLVFGTEGAKAQDNGPVQVVRVNPIRCLPVGDYSSRPPSIEVPSDSLVILQGAWLFSGDSDAKQFLKHTERVVTLGGEPIENEVDYWASEIFETEFQGSEALAIYWIYPAIGPLPDGRSLEVHWEFTALHDFSDGKFTTPEGYHFEHDCEIIWGD